MNGSKVVLDTNVIIFASKLSIDTDKLLSSYDNFYVSIITYMEVYGYAFEDEKEKGLIDLLFDTLEVVDTNRQIADQAIVYRKSERKKIKLPDAVILATAKQLDAVLLTDDWDDFMGVEDIVKIQPIDDLKI